MATDIRQPREQFHRELKKSRPTNQVSLLVKLCEEEGCESGNVSEWLRMGYPPAKIVRAIWQYTRTLGALTDEQKKNLTPSIVTENILPLLMDEPGEADNDPRGNPVRDADLPGGSARPLQAESISNLKRGGGKPSPGAAGRAANPSNDDRRTDGSSSFASPNPRCLPDPTSSPRENPPIPPSTRQPPPSVPERTAAHINGNLTTTPTPTGRFPVSSGTSAAAPTPDPPCAPAQPLVNRSAPGVTSASAATVAATGSNHSAPSRGSEPVGRSLLERGRSEPTVPRNNPTSLASPPPPKSAPRPPPKPTPAKERLTPTKRPASNGERERADGAVRQRRNLDIYFSPSSPVGVPLPSRECPGSGPTSMRKEPMSAPKRPGSVDPRESSEGPQNGGGGTAPWLDLTGPVPREMPPVEAGATGSSRKPTGGGCGSAVPREGNGERGVSVPLGVARRVFEGGKGGDEHEERWSEGAKMRSLNEVTRIAGQRKGESSIPVPSSAITATSNGDPAPPRQTGPTPAIAEVRETAAINLDTTRKAVVNANGAASSAGPQVNGAAGVRKKAPYTIQPSNKGKEKMGRSSVQAAGTVAEGGGEHVAEGTPGEEQGPAISREIGNGKVVAANAEKNCGGSKGTGAAGNNASTSKLFARTDEFLLIRQDVTNGWERFEVACVNEYESKFPPLDPLWVYPEDFHYINISMPYTGGDPIGQAALEGKSKEEELEALRKSNRSVFIDGTIQRAKAEACECVDNCIGDSCKCTGDTYGRHAYNDKGQLLEVVEPIKHKKDEGARPNLVFITECNKLCRCNRKLCGNRVIQGGIAFRLQVFMTPEGKGWGIRALEVILKGYFVFEYCGEILTNEEQDARNQEYEREGRKRKFPVALDGDSLVEGREPDWDGLSDRGLFNLDATKHGNIARFLNHSCSGNLLAKHVQIDSRDTNYYHLAFFALDDIQVGQELTWDYGCQPRKRGDKTPATKCLCGSKKCRGWLFM